MAETNDPSSAPMAEPATPPSGAAPHPDATPTGKNVKPGHGFADEEDEWRHPPVAPKDKGLLDSLGRAVSEAVTGADAPPAPAKPAGTP